MFFEKEIKGIKRLIITVFSFTILLIGVVMLVAPGPGILLIILSLAILAGEFVWARKLLKKLNKKAEKLIGKKNEKKLEKIERKLSTKD